MTAKFLYYCAELLLIPLAGATFYTGMALASVLVPDSQPFEQAGEPALLNPLVVPSGGEGATWEVGR